MATFVYNHAALLIANGSLNLNSDTLKVMLVTSGYSADRDHDFVSTASGSELSGTGYTAGFGGAGRKTLSNKAFTEVDASDRAEFDNTVDVTWTAINAGTAAGLILIKEITNDAASLLIAYYDFAVVTNGGDVTAQINAAGLIQFSTV